MSFLNIYPEGRVKIYYMANVVQKAEVWDWTFFEILRMGWGWGANELKFFQTQFFSLET